MPEPHFSIEGYSVRRLSDSDSAELQTLFERCSDYVHIYSGAPPRPTEGEEELRALPPGKELRDKFSFGLYNPQQQLVAYIDLMRNYPAEHEWWIGLLMVDPLARRRGLGHQVYGASAQWVRDLRGHRIWIGVLEENADAERFWRRLGFEEVRREAHKTESGKLHTMVVLRHDLSGCGIEQAG